MSKINNDIAIVGSGITGLTAGYRLKKNGMNVTIFEKNSHAGGAIKSVKQKNYLTEYGPNTLLLKDKVVTDLLNELELDKELIEANAEAQKRYIVKGGSLLALPGSLWEAIRTPLFSFPGKMRLLIEPFVSKSKNADQTVAEFAKKRLGSEMLDYAINPFVAGIFANNPESLSLRHAFPVMHEMEQEYGSLIAGSLLGAKKRKEKGRIKRRLISFRNGLQTLPDRLATDLNILYNHRVTAIDKRGNGWYVHCSGSESGPFGRLLINIPLYLMHEIRTPFQDELEAISKEVYYPPLSIVHLALDKRTTTHDLDGFGFLVPEKENRKILGALFSSTLFNNRAPDDHHLITVFIGGGRQPELAELESEQIFKMVQKELMELIGLKGKPIYKDHVYWPKSIPAYHVGYDGVEKRLMEIEKKVGRLVLAGNYRNGISVPDCIRNGLKIADRIYADPVFSDDP